MRVCAVLLILSFCHESVNSIVFTGDPVSVDDNVSMANFLQWISDVWSLREKLTKFEYRDRLNSFSQAE